MIQVPLSRLSSAFCFITAFLAWLIDYKTKQDIYNCLQYVFWKLAHPTRSAPVSAQGDDALGLPAFKPGKVSSDEP